MEIKVGVIFSLFACWPTTAFRLVKGVNGVHAKIDIDIWSTFQYVSVGDIGYALFFQAKNCICGREVIETSPLKQVRCRSGTRKKENAFATRLIGGLFIIESRRVLVSESIKARWYRIQKEILPSPQAPFPMVQVFSPAATCMVKKWRIVPWITKRQERRLTKFHVVILKTRLGRDYQRDLSASYWCKYSIRTGDKYIC